MDNKDRRRCGGTVNANAGFKHGSDRGVMRSKIGYFGTFTVTSIAA
jgi:hypothetical protein